MSFSPLTDRSLPCGCPAHAARAQRALAGGRYWLEGPSTPLWGRFWRRRTGLAGWRPLIKHLPPPAPPPQPGAKGVSRPAALADSPWGQGDGGFAMPSPTGLVPLDFHPSLLAPSGPGALQQRLVWGLLSTVHCGPRWLSMKTSPDFHSLFLV